MRRDKKVAIFAFLLIGAYIVLIGITNQPAHAYYTLCGRMTGGGVYISAQDETTRITHGFELHCGNPVPGPNSLEINWDRGNRFHLESVTSSTCFDDPDIDPAPPEAPFDTLWLTGKGRYNGVSGYDISITLTDAGEPGDDDEATFVITDSAGNFILRATGVLIGGNHQAHKVNDKLCNSH